MAQTNKRLTAHEYARNTLREAIVNGTLKAGDPLVQGDLAVELGVSITPVREALRDLSAEGLVRLTPNRGTFVQKLDLGDIEEVYELRIVLEPLMVKRMVGNISSESLEEARRLDEAMTKTVDLKEWAQLNRQFHTVFSQQKDESELGRVLDRLRIKAETFVLISLQSSPSRIDESNKEHSLLIEYFESINEDGAVKLTVQHLRSTIDLISATFRSKVEW